MKNISAQFNTDLMNKFNANFMRKREHLSWRAPYICEAIVDVLAPDSVVDFGCGHGDLVDEFLKWHISSFGVDGSIYAKQVAKFDPKRLFILDITKRIAKNKLPMCDLSICLEVFSVIEKDRFPVLVSNLLRFSNTLLIGCGEDKRFNLETILQEKYLHRAYEKEDLIKTRLNKFKRKLAIKAFWYGLMIWEKGEKT